MEEKENKITEKNYKKHLFVFLSAFFIVLLVSRFLPAILNISERPVERATLAGFLLFLVSFLFWLKKS